MPETHDLDTLFAEMERDVAQLTHAPGADTAVRGSRRRRVIRSGVVAAAAVAVVAVLARATFLPGGHQPSVASTDRGQPAYGDLTATALSDATSEWVGPWTHEPGGVLDDPPASAECWTSAVSSSDAFAERRGQNTYTAGDGVTAELVGLAYGSQEHGVAAYHDLSRAVERCGLQPDSTFSYPDAYSDGVRVTHLAGPSDAASDLQLWMVDGGQWILLFETTGAADDPSDHTVARVSDALAGALDGNEAFHDPAAPRPPRRLRDLVVWPEQLAPALEGWATPWSPETSGQPTPLPCLTDNENDWTGYTSAGAGAMSEGHNGEVFVSVYESEGAAQDALDRVVGALGDCGFRVHSVRSADGNEVQVAARPGDQAVWITTGGATNVELLRVPIDTAPPDSVTAKVADVMHAALTRPDGGD